MYALQQQHEADGQLRLREENVVLRRNISTLGEENSTLRRNISTLREENSSLREENIALQQEITYYKRSKPGWWEGLGTRLITGFKSSELYNSFGQRYTVPGIYALFL